MDPNNNQTSQPMTNANPAEQPVMPPQAPVNPIEGAVPPVQPTTGIPPMPPIMPTTMSQNPPKKGSKLPVLLVILLILILGMGGYVMFAKNQMNTQQKVATENQNTVIPAPTVQPVVTPATVDDVNIASPDADLNSLDKDVQGL
jgi:uncharacterized protein HemX